MLLPRIEKVIEEHNGVNLVKIDIDDNVEIAMKYGVSVLLNHLVIEYWKIFIYISFVCLYLINNTNS